MRFQYLLAAMLAAAGMHSGAAVAQAYPSKPLRLILNVSSGTVGDVVMRSTAQELSRQMGQPWVVENLGGGNFVIAANACKRALPDGYTVCMTNLAAMSLNPFVVAGLSYDPEKDFTPITNLFSQMTGLVAGGTVPANNVAELQALAVAKPGTLNFGTLGVASNADILRAWLGDRWKTSMVGVPYKGMPPIVNDLLAGQIHLSWTAIGAAANHARAGKLKILAINTVTRAKSLPDVPTLEEAGLGEYPGLVWWGMVGPAGMPDAAVRRVNTEVLRAFKEPRLGEVLDGQFVETLTGTPEQFAEFMKRDRERVGLLVKRINIPRQ